MAICAECKKEVSVWQLDLSSKKCPNCRAAETVVGPKRGEDGYWRSRTDEDLATAFENPDNYSEKERVIIAKELERRGYAVSQQATLSSGAGENVGVLSQNLSHAPRTNLDQSLVLGGILGFFLGGFIGFLLRPANIIGQLDFGTVIQRGANLSGMDILLRPLAATSFNYMLAGAVVGCLAGLGMAYLMAKRS